MKLFRITCTAILCLLAAVSAAQAQGKYVSLMGGMALLEDSDNTQGASPGTAEFEPGPVLGAAVGFGFVSGFRFEAELSYRGNDADRFGGATSLAANGDMHALSVMGNVSVDLPFFGSVWNPYLMAGAGYALVSADLSTGGGKIVDDQEGAFAYQFGGGVTVEVGPRIDLFVDYRYFATEDLTFTDSVGSPFGASYTSHSVNVGVRLGF